jgi:DNA-binding LytR/AlgR family response regulator
MSLARSPSLVHLKGHVRRVVDADDIYYLEAQGDETDVRMRGARPLRDVRSLGEVLEELGPVGLVRIHRNHAVHPGRVREIRPASSGSGWEVRLEPPVNKVLPVSRRSLTVLLAAYRPAKS